MRDFFAIFLLGIACFRPHALAQEPAEVNAGKTRTYIPHPLAVPEFTPPAPVEPKPVPAMRVASSITAASKGSRELTIIRGEASTLSDLPVPPKPVPSVQRELTQEELERLQFHRRHDLHIGATTYDHRVSVVRWHHPDTREFYEAACGFDIGLLEGTGGFIHNGESYSLMLLNSNIDTAAILRISKIQAPDVPEVPADSIIILKGDPDDSIGMAPVTVLRDIVAAEKTRLIPYQAARLRYQKAATAWSEAHPRVPRDETFWFKPHRGSRYLKPARQGGDQ